MTRSWHDRHCINRTVDEDDRQFYRSIVADKKPYFMRYIYPDLMRNYNTYIQCTNRNALREFGVSIHDMLKRPYAELTNRQIEFLKYYEMYMPVGTGDCVMNKICKRFEKEFDGYLSKYSKEHPFDYTIMKNDEEYTKHQYYEIMQLYEEHNAQLKDYMAFSKYEMQGKDDAKSGISMMQSNFSRKCSVVCPNGTTLANIVLDLCYRKSATKRFAWSMCPIEIINTLLAKNEYKIEYPVLDPDGEIEYCGERYKLSSKIIEVIE